MHGQKSYLVGEQVTVTLEKIYPYGVFVRLDANTRGFIRRRELSLSGDVDPKLCFAAGQSIEAVIIALPATGRLLELSHRQVLPDPWQEIPHQFQLGAVVAATVKHLRPAGIYVEIMTGVRGFVPRTELPKWVEATAVEQIWWEGDQIEAVITRIDHADHLILLSIRQRLQQRTQAEQVLRFLDQHPEPIATETITVTAQSIFEPAATIGQGEHIVVVENVPLLREQLIAWLNKRGFVAEGAADLATARLYLQQPAWLILVDIDLDGENGLHLIQEIEQTLPQTSVAVMSTPDWLEQESIRLASLRLAEVFTKPLNMNEISGFLQKLLNGEKDSPKPLTEFAVAPGTKPLSVLEPLPKESWSSVAQLNTRLTQLVEDTKAELGLLFHIDPASHIVSVVTSSGALPFDRTRLTDMLDSPIKDVIQEGKPVYDLRVSAEAKAKYRKLLLLAPFESCIGVPVAVWGEANHALFLLHRAQDAFSYYRVRDAQASAALCAAVLERERLEQRLGRLAGLLLSGQLAAVLAHEVFNKMSSLEISLLNLQTDCDQLGHDVANLAASAKYKEMQQTVAGLLDAHKSLKSTVTLFQQLMRTSRTGAIDVNAVIREAEALVRPLAHKYSIKVAVKLEPALPKFYGNALQLQQVFLNIMLNAVQQMVQSPSEGRRLEVTTSHEQDDSQAAIFIRFRDDGPGIHRHLWERIFDLGFTTRTGGSGLGLYIARSLVAANGGEIQVEHSAIPVGTVFTVTLPVSSPQEKSV